MEIDPAAEGVHCGGGTPLSPLTSTALSYGSVISGTNLGEQLKAISEADGEDDHNSNSTESTTVSANDRKLLLASKVSGNTTHDGSNSDPAELSAHSASSDSEASEAEKFSKLRSKTLRPMPEARQTRSATKKDKEMKKLKGSKARRIAKRSGDDSEQVGTLWRSPRKHQPKSPETGSPY